MKCMADGLKKVCRAGDQINLRSWNASQKRFEEYTGKLLKIANSGVTVELANGSVQKLGFSHVRVPAAR